MNDASWITITLASASPRRLELLAQIGVAAEVRPTHADEDSITLEQLRTEGPTTAELVAELARRRAHLKIAGARPAPGAPLILAADTIVSLDGELLEKPVDAADTRRMLTLLSGRTHLVHTAVVLRLADAPEASSHGSSMSPAPEASSHGSSMSPAPEASSHGSSMSLAPEASSHGSSMSPAPEASSHGSSMSPAPEASSHGSSTSRRPTLDDVVLTRVTFAPLTAGEVEAYIASEEWRGVAGGYRIQGRAGAFVTHIEGSYGAVVGLPIGRVYSMLKRLSGITGFAHDAGRVSEG